MMKFTTLVYPVLFAASSLTALAEKHVLAKGDGLVPVGKELTLKTEFTLSNGKMMVSAGGQEVEAQMSMTRLEEERLKRVSDTEIRFTQTKSDQTVNMKMMGQEMPQPKEVDPILNKEVIYTKSGEAWVGKLAEGEPEGAALTKIIEKATSLTNKNSIKMYGSEPRAIGDEWEGEPSAFGMGGNETTGKINLKFLRVEEFQGEKCAVLEVKINIKGQDVPGMEIGMDMNGTVHRSLANLVDLKVEATGTMTMDNPQMKMKGPLVIKMTSTLK